VAQNICSRKCINIKTAWMPRRTDRISRRRAEKAKGVNMIINHNLSAMFADRSLKVTQVFLDKNMEKLSSGLRINRAGDDASGLAVSEKMRAQIRGLNQASTNAQNGISFIQTTEGYLQETEDIVQRLRELSVQAANGIYTEEDRIYIQIEVSALVDEIDRIASHAQFNGMNLLTGRFGRPGGENVVTASMWFHIGANMDQREQVFIGTMTTKGLGIRNVGDDSFITLSDPDGANRAIGTLDKSLKIINKQRADLGAYQNRLEHAVRGLDVGAENLQASESRIRDTHMASETVKYTTNMILTQSGTAMLAQANQKGQSVLQLLQ
jgi:flagellin